MGGVRVDPETQMSRVPGLFAAGEVAGGLHGANRLGGNSLSDLLVFGRRAGLGAANYARENAAVPPVSEPEIERVIKEMYEPFDRPSSENAFTVTYDLQTTMEANVGIARVESELQQALSDLEALKGRAKKVSVVGDCRFNPGWHQVLDLNNLLICAEALAKAAAMRKESRGGHMRIDFPETSPEEGKWNNILRRGDEGQMVLEKVPLPILPDDLKALVEDKKAEKA
jgi:succinate dehydrogenase / fumarate reductase flavoprotein subunit